MAYEIKEFPLLSWSFSRMKMLDECPRKYFNNYYAYHNGWLREADEESQKIYRLKNLQGIDAYFGQTFHTTVKDAVMDRKKELILPDIFRRKINRSIKTAYQESLNSFEDWCVHPKWYNMFTEIYYEGDISKEKKDSIIKKIDITSNNVFSSQSFKELTENDVEIIELDELKSFKVNRITAFVKIDAFYHLGDKFVIVDWKTSAKDSISDIEQVIFYVWYVNQVLGIKLEDIEARLEYILQKKTEVYNFKDGLGFIDRKLEQDFKKIKTYLLNPEINQPLPKEQFFQVKGSSICRNCNFKEVC